MLTSNAEAPAHLPGAQFLTSLVQSRFLDRPGENLSIVAASLSSL